MMPAFYFYSSRYFKTNMHRGEWRFIINLFNGNPKTYEDRVSCVLKSGGQNSRRTFLDLTLIFNM